MEQLQAGVDRLTASIESCSLTPAKCAAPAVAVAVAALYLIRRGLLPKPYPGIPYDEEASKRILGDLPGYASAVNERDWIINRGIQLQSPIFQLFLGPHMKPTIFVTDFAELVDITLRHSKDFDRSLMHIEGFKPLQPESRFTIHVADPRFKRNLELVRDLMTPKFLHEVSAPHIHNTILRLMDLWDKKLGMAGGEFFDVGSDIHNAALDMIAMASYGLDESRTQLVRELREIKKKPASSGGKDKVIEFETPPLNEELAGLVVLADSLQVAMRSPIPKIHYTLYSTLSPTMRKAKADVANLRRREILAGIKRREEGKAEHCAVDSMLAREAAMAAKEGRAPNPHSEVISSELLSYLLGGHETTSAAIRWGLKYLSDYQHVQDKVRDALRAAYPAAVAENRQPSLDEILKNRVPYLDATIEEILRHGKALPITMRDTLVDTEVMGIPVPKGTTVALVGGGPGITMKGLGPASKKYGAGKAKTEKYGQFSDEDIEEFIPERWLKPSKGDDGVETLQFDPMAGAMFAFGLGPRGCAGKKLAYLEMKIVFAALIWKYKFKELPKDLAAHDEVVFLARAPKFVYANLEKL